MTLASIKNQSLFSCLAIATLAFINPAIATAQDLDGQFLVSEPSLQTFYQDFSAQQNPVMNKDTAKQVVQLIFADNQITDAEKDMLRELARTDKSQVNAVLNNQTISVPVATPAARAFINIIFKPADLNVLWAGDAQDLMRIIDTYEISPKIADNVQKAIANQLNRDLEKSTIYNVFAPLREKLVEKHDQGQELPGDYPEKVDRFLFETMDLIKTTVDKKPSAHPLPPYLYNWLDPDAKNITE